MSNIERRYAYYDEGVLPEEGEYGVTYLTLYSSNAGNIYNGWVWDPDYKIPESFVERTFGYRNLEYPNYVWDDEVVVDLSNAQNRQESSEFEQGRMTSFNTNVSHLPIILQDVDVTGLTEEEREAKATTVLFSAIPLVKDAYIQAMIEVQMKVNISQTNTNGMVRVEAFYILNDESDRTMRPNPVHTFAVATPNERHTLPFLYWNPALLHESSNYIGVKLLCTGGTAEIGISDDPEYGDAMITLTSAGLTGDRIPDARPSRLWMQGREYVPYGYKLDVNDYYVYCEYTDGSTYIVTRLCEFNPPIGTEIEGASFTLTATYMGMTTSMVVYTCRLLSIELMGIEAIYNPYTLNINDFTVIGHFEHDNIDIITDKCTFSPAMGTTISSSTTLTASIEEPVSHEIISDSLEIAMMVPIETVSPHNGLVYKLYDNNLVEISGNPNIEDEYGNQVREVIELPTLFKMYMDTNHIPFFAFDWQGTGAVGGVRSTYNQSANSYPRGCTSFRNFNNLTIKPYFRSMADPTNKAMNPIHICFTNDRGCASSDLAFLHNIVYDDTVSGKPAVITKNGVSNSYSIIRTNLDECFKNCTNLSNLNFMTDFRLYGSCSFSSMCKGCTGLTDVSGICDLAMINAEIDNVSSMFYDCTALTSVSCFNDSTFDLSNVYEEDAEYMFYNSGLESFDGIDALNLGNHEPYMVDGEWSGVVLKYAFCHTNVTDLRGLENLIKPDVMFVWISDCPNLESLRGIEDWPYLLDDTKFHRNPLLEDISALSQIDTSNVTTAEDMFVSCPNIKNISSLNSCDMSNCINYVGMFHTNPKNGFYALTSGTNWPGSSGNKDEIFALRPGTNDIYFMFYYDSSYPRQPQYLRGYTAGMFGGRDEFRIIADSYESSGNITDIHFLHTICPLWYQQMVRTDFINQYHTISDLPNPPY